MNSFCFVFHVFFVFFPFFLCFFLVFGSLLLPFLQLGSRRSTAAADQHINGISRFHAASRFVHCRVYYTIAPNSACIYCCCCDPERLLVISKEDSVPPSSIVCFRSHTTCCPMKMYVPARDIFLRVTYTSYNGQQYEYVRRHNVRTSAFYPVLSVHTYISHHRLSFLTSHIMVSIHIRSSNMACMRQRLEPCEWERGYYSTYINCTLACIVHHTVLHSQAGQKADCYCSLGVWYIQACIFLHVFFFSGMVSARTYVQHCFRL